MLGHKRNKRDEKYWLPMQRSRKKEKDSQRVKEIELVYTRMATYTTAMMLQ